MLVGIHARSKTFFVYDPQGEVGQKESIRNAIRVYIDKEAASSGLVDSSLGSAKEWGMLNVLRKNNWIHTIAEHWF